MKEKEKRRREEKTANKKEFAFGVLVLCNCFNGVYIGGIIPNWSPAKLTLAIVQQLQVKEKERIHIDKQGRRPCEDGNQDWSDAATLQRLPKIASNHQKLGEKHGTDSPWELPKRTNSGD